MDIQEALDIVRKLSDGLDPDSGSSCRSDSILHNPRVIIALHRATGALEAQAERELERQNQPRNAHRYWSKAEDQQLCQELRQGDDLRQIAKRHNRTVPSIAARLIKIGEVAPVKTSEALFPGLSTKSTKEIS